VNARKRKSAEKAYARMCHHLGIKLKNETLETPRRVVKMLEQMTANKDKINDRYPHRLPFDFKLFKSRGNDIVVMRDICFVSICQHHFVPFYGTVGIGYLPGKHIVGFSKLPQLVEFFSKVGTLQEEFTHRIAAELEERLKPEAVCVLSKAHHACVCAGTGDIHAATKVCVVLGQAGLQVKDEILEHIK